MTDTQAKAKFDSVAGYLRIVAESFLREQFGERCKDFEPNCECCKRWKLLDGLVKSPWEKQ